MLKNCCLPWFVLFGTLLLLLRDNNTRGNDMMVAMTIVMTLTKSFVVLIVCLSRLHLIACAHTRELSHPLAVPTLNEQTVVPVTIVVSHCKESLEWVSTVIDEIHGNYSHLLVKRVNVFSKCLREVVGAPEGSTITRIQNVGRCDHTYAHFIAHMDVTEGVVLFLKDTRHVYWEWKVKDVENSL